MTDLVYLLSLVKRLCMTSLYVLAMFVWFPWKLFKLYSQYDENYSLQLKFLKKLNDFFVKSVTKRHKKSKWKSTVTIYYENYVEICSLS